MPLPLSKANGRKLSQYVDLKDWARFKATRLKSFPPREQKILTWHFHKGFTQKECAERLGISQPAVAYRVQSILHRLQFQEWRSTLTKANFEKDLAKVLDPETIELVSTFWQTASQSRTAECMGCSQSRARYKLLRAMKVLFQAADQEPKYEPYADALRLTFDNLNSLKGIRSQWLRWRP